jgi:hypothetical protein
MHFRTQKAKLLSPKSMLMASVNLWDKNTVSLDIPVGVHMKFLRIPYSMFDLALKWFDEKGNIEPYEGGRDLDALASLCAHYICVASPC